MLLPASVLLITHRHRGHWLSLTAPAMKTWRQAHIGECYLWRMGVLERRTMMRCDVSGGGAPGQLQEAGSADGRGETATQDDGSACPLHCTVPCRFLAASMGMTGRWMYVHHVTQKHPETQSWAPVLCPGGQYHAAEPARWGDIGRLDCWGDIAEGGRGTPIALRKDLTCSLQSTTPSVPIATSTRPPDGRYRPSVVDERGEARVPSLAWYLGVVLEHPGSPCILLFSQVAALHTRVSPLWQ